MTSTHSIHLLATLLVAALLCACGDDDDFTPVAKNRGYDYAFTSTKEFAEYPCNEIREGREAVVGRDKDSYYCEFDSRDSVYLWIGDEDTLTAIGREYHHAESSSSSDEDDENSSSSRNLSSSWSSSSSSYRSSSSSYSSSSARSSSSSARSSSSYWPSTWSSENPSSSFSISSKEDLFNPDLTYGTMTDPRDGKKYKTIVFNGQTWMAENLNFADSSIYPLLKGNTRCYHEKESECELFGRLYSREAAMGDSDCAFGFSCSLGSGPIQGICPDNWHVMSATEASSMINYVGSDNADKIMSAKGWGSDVYGTNTYGLSFIAPGTRDGVNYDSKGGYAYYWIYIEYTSQYYFYINGPSKYMNTSNYNNHELYLPVRCIADDPTSSSSYSSSSSLRSSSSKKKQDIEPLLEAAGDQFNPDLTYGTMTDPRDNKTYRTVEAAGTTWMAENLNYAGNEIGESVCFNEDDRFCELYGRFYSRDAAMNSEKCTFMSGCNLGSDPIQGICPDGWHIPTKKEAQDLVNLASGTSRSLRSAKGWKTTFSLGTDKYGLSFLGAGSYNVNEGFYSLGEYEHVWVYYASSYQYYIVIRGSSNESEVWDFLGSEVYNPVRCVKDE